MTSIATSPELLEQTITTFQEDHPESLLVGSLGRTAYFGEAWGEFGVEYRFRGEEPLIGEDEKPRDVDLILPGVMKAIKNPSPHLVDTHCYAANEVLICKEGADWLLRSRTFDFCERLEPEVMEPQRKRIIYSIEANVPRFRTLVALHGMPGGREKDLTTQDLLGQVSDEIGQGSLPERYYDPFRELKEVQRNSAYGRARRLYKGVLPMSLRLQLRGPVGPLKNFLSQ